MVGALVIAPKSVTFRRHDHLVSVLFGDLLSHSYNITFSMFLYLYYYNLYAVAVVKSGVVVEHVPRKVSSVCSLFLRGRGGGGRGGLFTVQLQERGIILKI